MVWVSLLALGQLFPEKRQYPSATRCHSQSTMSEMLLSFRQRRNQFLPMQHLHQSDPEATKSKHFSASYPRFQEGSYSESCINLQDKTKHSRMEALNLWQGIPHYFISHLFPLLSLSTGFNRRNFWIANLFLLNFFPLVIALIKQWTFAIKYCEAFKIAIMCILYSVFFL